MKHFPKISLRKCLTSFNISTDSYLIIVMQKDIKCKRWFVFRAIRNWKKILGNFSNSLWMGSTNVLKHIFSFHDLHMNWVTIYNKWVKIPVYQCLLQAQKYVAISIIFTLVILKKILDVGSVFGICSGSIYHHPTTCISDTPHPFLRANKTSS